MMFLQCHLLPCFFIRVLERWLFMVWWYMEHDDTRYFYPTLSSWSMSVVWYFNGTYYDNLLKLLCIPVLRGGVPHIGIDHQWLTINFELKFFVSTCFHMIWGFQNPVCLRLFVHTPGPRKRNRPGFVNISHTRTLVIHTSYCNINGKVFTNMNTTSLKPKILN